MIGFHNNRAHRDLYSLAPLRKQARRMESNGNITGATQLLRFGVCPCIIFGKYNQCCGPLHGSLRT